MTHRADRFQSLDYFMRNVRYLIAFYLEMKRLRESLTAYLKGHSTPSISSLFEGGSRLEIELLFDAVYYGKLYGDFFFGMGKVFSGAFFWNFRCIYEGSSFQTCFVSFFASNVLVLKCQVRVHRQIFFRSVLMIRIMGAVAFRFACDSQGEETNEK